MPAPPDPARWERLPDGSYRRYGPSTPRAEVQESTRQAMQAAAGAAGFGLESVGAAHPPAMLGKEAQPDEDVDATEAAAALAEELGVDITAVEGTGKDGRVTKADVESAVR